MITFLIGYMGSGKSSIGEMVARQLNIGFLDMDDEIATANGLSISEIFERYGEDHFRTLERELLERIVQKKDEMVIATGGGTPCFDSNMEIMNRSGATIYLKWSNETLVNILMRYGEDRPLIKGLSEEELRQYVNESLSRREPYYSQATETVCCDEKNDKKICKEVVELIEKINFTGEINQ